jgi:N-alpha-acetyltransferase 15/16, NatA auxiliary subunit
MTTPLVDNRTLPKKEHDLFRSLIKCYEEKQYKKGIKNADTILKKFPNHGETQAMKGLIFNNMGRKDESYELVKLGLKNDVRSHVCWHVFGLLYRTDRNYKEAIKCYLNALRIDTDNQNILRDLSFLQIQMRDMNGFAETRRRILTLKPTNKIHWISYAVGLYTSGSYTTANEVLEKFLTTSLEERAAYEQSELYLFQNLCLEATGAYDAALTHLHSSQTHIVDQLSWNTKKGELLIKLEQWDEALVQWTMLLNQQPDNYYFHCGYQVSLLRLPVPVAKEMLQLKQLNVPSSVLDLSPEQLVVLREAYQISRATPKSTATTRILLSLFPLTSSATVSPDASETEREFKLLLGDYIKRGLRKGIPNLYNDLCALIRVPDHRLSSSSSSRRFVYAKDKTEFVSHPVTVIILDLLESYILALKTNGTFDLNPSEEAITEVPTTLLWAYYLRAHLLGVCGRNEEALRDIELSIQHTPTSLDSLAKRARILKNCGDYAGAAEQMNYCRSLDLQDRLVSPLLSVCFPPSYLSLCLSCSDL